MPLLWLGRKRLLGFHSTDEAAEEAAEAEAEAETSSTTTTTTTTTKTAIIIREPASPAAEEEDDAPLVDGLEFLHLLGQGGFGRVWKARKLCDGSLNPSSSHDLQQFIAVKVIRRTLELASAMREVEVWRFLSSQSASRLPSMPFMMPIVQMLGLHSSSDRKHVCISMQLCTGGTLAAALPLAVESTAMSLAHTLALGLHFMHSLGVVHLDIKPDNVLFPSIACRDACRGALLADFGLSLFIPDGTEFSLKGPGAGTCGYQAPEVITHGIYSPAADSWSLGALLLEVLTGRLPPHDPFGGPDELIVEFEQWGICDSVEPSWVDEYMNDVWNCPRWAALLPSAKDAIRWLLCPNPSLRLTPLQLLQHPWLKDEQILYQRYLAAILPLVGQPSSTACAATMVAAMPVLSHVPLCPPPGFV